MTLVMVLKFKRQIKLFYLHFSSHVLEEIFEKKKIRLCLASDKEKVSKHILQWLQMAQIFVACKKLRMGSKSILYNMKIL